MKRSRATTALVSALITLALLTAIWSPSSGAQEPPSTDPWEGSAFTSPTDGSTVTQGPVLAGMFKRNPPAPIAEIDLEVSAQTALGSGCATPPGQTSTTTTPEPPSSTSPDPPGTPTTEPSDTTLFTFHVTFVCNGVFAATATAKVDTTGSAPSPLTKDITVRFTVASPPPSPASFLATDNGNRTVTLTWTPPTSYSGSPGPPPDFLGYRLSRRDAAATSFNVLGTTTPDVQTFTDSNIPMVGGSYVYAIEAVRKFATSEPVVTSAALEVRGANGGGAGGGSVSGSPSAQDGSGASGSGGSGVQHFDEETLAADEGELGAGDPLAALPGGSTIQRFAGRDGAGLIKPFAAALDLGVWAGLLLFLTRRATSAERAAALAVELEHPS